MIKKVFVVPTIGERGNPNNPLRPALDTPNEVTHIVERYINNDKQAIVVVIGEKEADFKDYKEIGLEIEAPDIAGKYQHRRLKNKEIVASTEPEEIGKKEFELYNMSREEYFKRLKI